MTLRDVARARRKLLLAGAPSDHEQIRLSLLDRALYKVGIIRQRVDGLTDDFCRYLTAWLGVAVPAGTTPYALLNDIRIGDLYGVAAIAAVVGEMFLAGWFFQRNGIDWPVGALSVLFITVIFHASIFYVAYGSSGRFRPHQTLYNLRLFVWPAAGMFFVAVVLGVLPRYLQGPAAANQDVHNLLSLGLLAGTLSMMVLSSALACAHFIYTATRRYEKRYHTLLLQQRVTEAFLNELQRQSPSMASGTSGSAPTPAVGSSPAAATAAIGPATPAPAAGPSAPVPAGPSPATGVVRLLILLFLVVLPMFGSVGCGVEATTGDVRPVVTVNSIDSPLLEAEIDTSGSLESLDAAWSAIQPTLGVVASTYRCGTVIVSRFDCDGWVAKPLVKLELPAVQHAELPPLVGEWTGMTNVQEARREQRRILQAEADHRYADALRGALAPLDKIVLPAGDSAGSDIAGALHRYSQYRGARLRIVILLSDLGDTHCGTLPPVPAPTGNIRVLALVMPMKRKDANYLHEPLTGADQYETRCKWLRGGAPWVAVAPFFSNDAVELLGSIESGRHDR